MQVAEIRQRFFDFFRARDHKIVPSAPIVVKNDPSLMFTNAGMNQFKDIFLEQESAPHHRVADTQKCLRVSGKHNDLEEVGHDTYHHTMFEMLGNWSFGDYFKESAIHFAWELLTEGYGLSEDRLYVTIFEGDDQQDLPLDQEAYEVWKQLVPEDRILAFSKEENFWEMGDAGPCGPSSEIHFDFRPEADRQQKDAKALVNQDHPEVVELWNLVFIEFNRYQDGSLSPLPKKHIDTGLGLERLAAILQNKGSNYDTDVFQPLIRHVSQEFGVSYGQEEKTDVALRVVADHSRAITFTIGDGQLPGNTGAGYVIRRILRRAVRYGFQFLGADQPFLYRLVPLLAEQFDGVFPEVKQQQDFIQQVVQEEEQSFLRTLAVGTKLFEQQVTKLTGDTIPGAFAFELYDTYGFPLDLTRLMAEEKGLKVDEAGFQEGLKQQQQRSKKAQEKTVHDWQIVREGEQSRFIGYDQLSASVSLLCYRKVETKKDAFYHLVLDQTPFYPESGGQVGDTGYLQQGSQQIRVTDTQQEYNLIVHTVRELPENLEGELQAVVDQPKRGLTARNHTATHLLQAALQEILGSHVDQKGSLVRSDYLRFDFSHYAKVEPDQLRQIEERINAKIREDIPLEEQRSIPIQEALNQGATALFGEKYGDYVRMVTFDPEFSRELCGGTHVQSTGAIGMLKITTETAVAAGIRRIEAVTGPTAEQYIDHRLDQLQAINAMLNNPKDPVQQVQKLQEQNKTLQKTIEQYQQARVQQLRDELIAAAPTTEAGYPLICQEVSLEEQDMGKDLTTEIQNKQSSAIVLLGARFDSKANLWLALPKALTDQGWDASQMIKPLAAHIQGGGGGKAHFANAGGKNAEGLAAALEEGQATLEGALQTFTEQ